MFNRGYGPEGWEFESLWVHQNRGIRTPRLRNRIFGFFFFCAVFVRAAVVVGIIGENQVQKQFVLLSAFQIEKHFQFIVVQHYSINKYVDQDKTSVIEGCKID